MAKTVLKVIADPPDPNGQIQLRRVYLLDKATGLPCEREINFIDNVHSTASVNSQIAVARALIHLREFQSMMQSSSTDWTECEKRVLNGQMPMTQGEFATYIRWCGLYLENLSSTTDCSAKIKKTTRSAVNNGNFNSRVIASRDYFVHLATYANANESSDRRDNVRRNLKASLLTSFTEKLVDIPKSTKIHSLSSEDVTRLREVLKTSDSFNATACGRRDRLIIKILLEALRAGELLKLSPDQIHPAPAKNQPPFIDVVRDAQSADDERTPEPAVKTRSGTLPISKVLFEEIQFYILGDRRAAIEERADEKETSQLFINHSGNPKFIGKAMTQRNLNRIVTAVGRNFEINLHLHPHVFRHTGLNELADEMVANNQPEAAIRRALEELGRFAPSSPTLDHYTRRHNVKKAAEFKKKLDDKIYGKSST